MSIALRLKALIKEPWFPILSYILGIVGIVAGIVVPTVFWQLSQQDRELVYQVYEEEKIANQELLREISDIRIMIEHGNQTIEEIKEDVSYVTMSFWNRGRKDIELNDLWDQNEKEHFLTIESSPKVDILLVAYDSMSEHPEFYHSLLADNRPPRIAWDKLEKDEGATVKIFYLGHSAKFFLAGTVRGQGNATQVFGLPLRSFPKTGFPSIRDIAGFNADYPQIITVTEGTTEKYLDGWCSPELIRDGSELWAIQRGEDKYWPQYIGNKQHWAATFRWGHSLEQGGRVTIQIGIAENCLSNFWHYWDEKIKGDKENPPGIDIKDDNYPLEGGKWEVQDERTILQE